MKQMISLIKPYCKWFIFGLSLIFVINIFQNNWQSIRIITLDNKSFLYLILAFFITFSAHIWSALIWVRILKVFKQPTTNKWGLKIYLVTNIAKYIPGNVGHFYGRISGICQQGGSLRVASFIVFLEPLLMAASALLIALASNFIGLIETASNPWILIVQILILITVLLGIHPIILNKLIYFLNKSKQNLQENVLVLESYPSLILLGELVFVILRGIGFICVWIAFTPVSIVQIPLLLSAFSFAWLLGLVIPGAPGGMGIFEATLIALLKTENFPIGVVLSSLTIFRLISILAEVSGAGLGLLIKKN